MTPIELLLILQRKGVFVTADGDRIRFAPVGAVTGDLLAALSLHKAQICALLAPVAGVERACRTCGGDLIPFPWAPDGFRNWDCASCGAVEPVRESMTA